jgi:hypothetical protein
VLLPSVAIGSVLTAALLLPVTVIASVSAVRAAAPKAESEDPAPSPALPVSPTHVAIATAVLLPLSAIAGPTTFILIALLVGGAGGAILALTQRGQKPLVALVMLAAVLAPSVAAASVVLAVRQGSNEAVTLVAAVCLYDMASFIVGNGRNALGGLFGVIAGWISVGVLAVLVAASMNPPYSGHKPLLLFGLVAILAPAGVALTSLIVRGARLPALRRLDAFVLAGPAWVFAVSAVLHR